MLQIFKRLRVSVWELGGCLANRRGWCWLIGYSMWVPVLIFHIFLFVLFFNKDKLYYKRCIYPPGLYRVHPRYRRKNSRAAEGVKVRAGLLSHPDVFLWWPPIGPDNHRWMTRGVSRSWTRLVIFHKWLKRVYVMVWVSQIFRLLYSKKENLVLGHSSWI
jgi:hypothetical protein